MNKTLWTALPATVVTLIMLMWAGHSLARLFWAVATPAPQISADSKIPGRLPPAADTRAIVDLDKIRRAFSLSESSGFQYREAALYSGSQPETQLNLTLHASVHSDDPSMSQAIIASGDRQQVYRSGDTIKGTAEGVRLLGIYEKFVTIENNGQEERLRLYETEEDVIATTADTLAVNSEPPAASTPVDFNNVGLNRIIRLQKRDFNDESSGFQIRYGSRADILSDAGLQVGDLITAIDGEPVTDAVAQPALFERLLRQNSVQLQLLRNEQILTVDLSRTDLGLPAR